VDVIDGPGPQQVRSRFDAQGWGPAEQAVMAALLGGAEWQWRAAAVRAAQGRRRESAAQQAGEWRRRAAAVRAQRRERP